MSTEHTPLVPEEITEAKHFEQTLGSVIGWGKCKCGYCVCAHHSCPQWMGWIKAAKSRRTTIVTVVRWQQ